MNNAYFTDSEYHILLSALDREEKINKKLTSKTLKSLKRKLTDIQSDRVEENFASLGRDAVDSVGYCILHGAIWEHVYPEEIISEIYDFCTLMGHSLVDEDVKAAYRKILQKELAEGIYLDRVRNNIFVINTENFDTINETENSEIFYDTVATVFGKKICRYLTEVVECYEDDANKISDLYKELAKEILFTNATGQEAPDF